MSSTKANGSRISTKQFYEALINQNTLREEANNEINEKLDGITSALAAGDEKFKAMDDKLGFYYKKLDKRIDKNETRLDNHDDDILESVKQQKIIGGTNAFLAFLAGLIGINQ